jgi:hypothetical protein
MSRTHTNSKKLNNRLLAVVTLLLSMTPATGNAEAAAKDWHLIELHDVAIEYRRFVDDGRDTLIYPHVHKEALNLSVDMDVLRYFYWDNTIHSLTDQSQYRGIGLELSFGIRLNDSWAVQYHHYSQHVLDEPIHTLPRFPVEDSVGIVFKLYTSPNPRRSLLGQ